MRIVQLRFISPSFTDLERQNARAMRDVSGKPHTPVNVTSCLLTGSRATAAAVGSAMTSCYAADFPLKCLPSGERRMQALPIVILLDDEYAQRTLGR